MRRASVALLWVGLLWCASPALGQDDVGAASEPICCGGDCCLIGGTCYDIGDRNPANACQICAPTQSQSDWSMENGCGPDAGGGGSGGGGGCAVSPTGPAGSASLVALMMAGFILFRRRR